MGMFGVVRLTKRGPRVSVGYATRFGGGSRRRGNAGDTLKGIGVLVVGFPVICILGFAYKFTGWLGVGVVGAMMIAAVWCIADTFEAIKAKTMTDAQLKMRVWICGASIVAFMIAFAIVAIWASGPPNASQGFSQNRDQPVHIEATTPEVREAERDQAKQAREWSAYQAKLKSREEIGKQKTEIAQSNRKLNEELRAYCTEDPTRCATAGLFVSSTASAMAWRVPSASDSKSITAPPSIGSKASAVSITSANLHGGKSAIRDTPPYLKS